MPDPTYVGCVSQDKKEPGATASGAALQRVREDRLLIDQVDLWLYEEIAPFLGQRVLEIGCGLGNFARHLTDRKLYLGTDLSTETVARVNRLYQNHPNMQARVADVTGVDFPALGRFEIDTVFALNVLEHIEDHVQALRQAKAVLQPGGTLILVVPAHDWLYGSMDRAIGHHRRYSKHTMAELFEQVGMRTLMLRYLNAMGALGWYVNGRIRRRETPPADQLHLFNRLVPLLKRLERAVPVPFGVSLLAVGQTDPSDSW